MFSDSDISKVMNHANITAGWLPTDEEVREVLRAAIATGVLDGVEDVYLTDEGDFIIIVERDGFRRITTGPISCRYMWKSGLTGARAVRGMLTKARAEATAARTGEYPNTD